MTIPGDIIIPALTFRTAGGGLDEATTARYAEAAAGTWLDYFILSGTTTEGDSFTVHERTRVLDIWLQTTEPSRLVACCWTDEDIGHAVKRGIRPMVVMRGLRNEHAALMLFQKLPAEAFVYSHPVHTSTVLGPALIERSTQSGCLPPGAKISKLSAEDIPLARKAAGPRFTLWDGSCRRFSLSLSSGASGVVATPYASLVLPAARGSQMELSEHMLRRQDGLDAVPLIHRARWLRAAFTSAWPAGQ